MCELDDCSRLQRNSLLLRDEQLVGEAGKIFPPALLRGSAEVQTMKVSTCQRRGDVDHVVESGSYPIPLHHY